MDILTAFNNYFSQPTSIGEYVDTGLQLIAISVFIAGGIIFFVERVKRWWILTEPARVARGLKAMERAKRTKYALYYWSKETRHVLNVIFK